VILKVFTLTISKGRKNPQMLILICSKYYNYLNP